jgi:hypothetical protein
VLQKKKKEVKVNCVFVYRFRLLNGVLERVSTYIYEKLGMKSHLKHTTGLTVVLATLNSSMFQKLGQVWTDDQLCLVVIYGAMYYHLHHQSNINSTKDARSHYLVACIILTVFFFFFFFFFFPPS